MWFVFVSLILSILNTLLLFLFPFLCVPVSFLAFCVCICLAKLHLDHLSQITTQIPPQFVNYARSKQNTEERMFMAFYFSYMEEK